MTADKMMVRVGGGYFKFDEHIPQNQQYYQKTLLMNMLKSKLSLEQVCENIMNDQKIPQAVSSPYGAGVGHNQITIERRPYDGDDEKGRNSVKRVSTAIKRGGGNIISLNASGAR